MRTFIVLLSLFVATGCDSSSDRETYIGALVNLEGVEVSEIDLAFETPETGEAIIGRYVLSSEIDGTPLSGELRVVRESDGSLAFSLGSAIPDTGVELNGTILGNRLSGTWSVITIAGPRPSGTFSVVRQ